MWHLMEVLSDEEDLDIQIQAFGQWRQREQYDQVIEPDTCKTYFTSCSTSCFCYVILFLLCDLFAFSIKMFLKVEEQEEKQKLKMRNVFAFIKQRAVHLKLSKMKGLTA